MPTNHFSDRSQFRRPSPFDNKPLRRVPGVGPQPCRCMLIGEKPGEQEARRGLPFIGISGKYLDIFLQAAAIERSSLYITNLVKEFTEYSKPTPEEITRDHDELYYEILHCEPEIIGLVGGWAVENVLGRAKADMDRTHGVPVRVYELFGGELESGTGWVVMPIYPPANCVHRPETAAQVLDDFLSLGKFLDKELTVLEDDPYEGQEDYQDFHGDEKDIIDVAGGAT